MRIGIVTCETLPEPDFDEPFLSEALVEAGHLAVPVPWDGHADLPDVDALLIRSCWNYYEDLDRFLTWIREAASRVPTVNSAEIVEWNAHKRYLEELGQRGVPVVPTVYARQGSSTELSEVVQRTGWSRIVVKPAVSAGSYRTRVFSFDELDQAQAFLDALTVDADAMVQPFLPSVLTAGERSVVWFGGEASHAVVKRPRFDGEEESVEAGGPPTAGERDLLDTCLEGLDVLYARLDLMEADGEWLVSELELIEPSLYFFKVPGTAERFVSALEQALRRT